MLQRVTLNVLNSTWQHALADCVTDPQELIALLKLPSELLPAAQRAATLFPLRVPRSYLARIEPGNPADPLLLQVLPLHAEFDNPPNFVHDPVGDLLGLNAPGLLQKYHGRALVIATGACAIHCRYCFRRHFPYDEHGARKNRWQETIDYLATHSEIDEVILSGGDPLSLSDDRLASWCRDLAGLPHVRRIRIHTRLPIVVPERITDGLLAALKQAARPIVCVVHANHANELSAEVASALIKLREAGIHLLNQSVLLKGVNDNVTALRTLSERLFDLGALPYYLHVLDKVAGAAHFDVPDATARNLHETLMAQLPGYLVPRLVRESVGAPNKLPL